MSKKLGERKYDVLMLSFSTVIMWLTTLTAYNNVMLWLSGIVLVGSLVSINWAYLSLFNKTKHNQ